MDIRILPLEERIVLDAAGAVDLGAEAAFSGAGPVDVTEEGGAPAALRAETMAAAAMDGVASLLDDDGRISLLARGAGDSEEG